MHYKSKYIIVDTGMAIAPIVFTELLTHADVARAIAPHGTVMGAGFCYVEKNAYVCYGESVSLEVKSRGEADSKILNKFLGTQREDFNLFCNGT